MNLTVLVITGVDDTRKIIDECRTRPLMGKYKIFILDECHMLTVQAWNSLLKILEEPPEYIVFLFCTTDPQKIIGTIMSRVQRFNFSRISTNGIYNRLKYIIESENNEKAMTDIDPITYDDEALKYIARLAKGGMRDSITTLEKCLDYNQNLSLANVQVVTSGGVNEETLLNFMKLLLNGDGKGALQCFNNVYMSGMDNALFIKLYIEYIENCIKFMMVKDADMVSLSEISLKWLNENDNFLPDLKIQLMSALNIKNNYSSEDLRIIIESWIIQSCN